MKKVLIGLLALLLVISGICFYNADSSEVLAAAGDVTTGDGFIAVEYDDLKDYRKSSGNVAPTAPSAYKSYIFAGWYEDEACQKVYKDVSADTTLAYAKFVPANVLSVKVQLKSGTTDKSESTNMRLVSSVDGTNYQEVGFEIYFDGATTPITTRSTKVYKRVVANAESGVDYNYSAKVVDVESKYFVTATLLNIKNTEEKPNFEKPFHIKPFWTTMDGTIVYGVSKYVTVNDGLDDDNINIPVRVGSGFNEDTAQVQVAGKEPANASVAYYDGTYAHLNIDVTNRASALKSLSVINVTDGTIGGSAEYRNLDTKYDGTADTTWYDANANKYTIATSADLYGLADIVNKGTTFGGKTVYVIADIEVNKGRATETGWSTYEEDGTTAIFGATSHVWTPIGYAGGKYFSGVFDGQGHTISGLNGIPTTTESEAFLGLFGRVDNGELKNFRLTNSYFEERTADSTNYTGSIVGRTTGNIDAVYSDAYIKGYTILTGGIAGRAHGDTDKKFSNCWYDGTIIVDGGTYTGGIVGQQFKGTLLLENCLFSGMLSYEGVSGNIRTGGFVGQSNLGLVIKNSLNSGKFVNVDSASVSGIGRVLGQNDAAITLEKVYVTNVGANNTSFWYNPGGLASGSEEPVRVEEADVIGVNAYCNDILVRSDEWVMTEKTPALALFADELVLPGNIDWYTSADATEYTICDNEDNEENVKDLYGFAYLVNAGIDFDEKIVKMAKDVVVNEDAPNTSAAWTTYLAENEETNVWTPIGTETNEFAGTFNGQMHSIKGIYVNLSELGAGLFKNTADGSTIKNLKLENSYINSTANIVGSVVGSCGGNLQNVYSNAAINTGLNYVGGLVGQVYSAENVDIKNCWYAGAVSAQSNVAGIVGVITKGTVLIENCLNSGNITIWTNKDTAGGLLARTFKSSTEWGLDGSGSNPSTTIKHSLNSGTITGRNNIGSAIGWPQRGTLTIENVYATKSSDGASVDNVGIGSLSTDTSITMVDLNDITGLKSHYNNILVGGEDWVPTDETPAPKVFTDGLLTASTDKINIDWFTGLDTLEYTICDEDTNNANVAELKGFAYLANHGIDFAGMTVTMANDVVVNAETISELAEEDLASLDVWTPIGSIAKPFAGTFDGGLHSISGLYATATSDGLGLFGATAKGSTVQNLEVLNSYFDNTTSYTGSIIGKSAGNLVNVYSEATVNGDLQVGGLVGQVYAADQTTLSIENCWFAGNVISTDNNTGGLVGSINYGVVNMTDCLNSGTVQGTTTKAFIGGLVGGMTADTSGDVTVAMTRCLNTGELTKVNTASDSWVGAILGRKNGYAAVTLTNVYATNESYFKAVGGTSIPSGSVMVNESDITGEYAFYNDILVNETAWVATETTPELKMFSNTEFELPELPANVDISWYAGSGTTSYTICDEDTSEANVAELNGFAYLVKSGISFAGATITMANDVVVNEEIISELAEEDLANLDVWSPIGTIANPFAGIFDGGLHSISGLYVTASTDGIGLFAATAKGSTVQNLKVLNSYFENTTSYTGSIIGKCAGNLVNAYSDATVSGDLQVGGLIGQVYAADKTALSIENCWFAGNVISTDNNTGGLVGSINYGVVNMTDCLNSGTVQGTTTKAFIGGLVGGMTADTSGDVTVAMTRCLNTGELTKVNTASDSWVGAILGRKNGYAAVTLTNVYATNESYFKAVGGTSIPSGSVMVDKSDITGELAVYNNVLVNETVWVATETTPELEMFSNTEYEVPVLASDVDIAWYEGIGTKTYTICDESTNEANVAELKGFAYLVNQGIDFAGITVTLANDVTLNEETISELTEEQRAELDAWTPIGTTEELFAGTFDGGQHSISGLYATATSDGLGLFGATATGSTVQNLEVLNSYFSNTAYYTGSIIGKSAGNVKNVYSNATVSGVQYTGGLIGYVYDESMKNIEINNSWFAGTVTASNVNLGGLIGAIDYGLVRITDCLNSADVKGNNKNFTGGLIGGMTAAAKGDVDVTVTRCLNVGKLTNVNTASGSFVGSILGRKNGNATMTTSNAYGVAGTHTQAIGSTSMPTGTYGLVDESEVLGNDAYYTLNSFGFDAESNWVLIEGSTPQLRLFADEAAILDAPEISENVDVLWYNGASSTYTITTAEELYGFSYLASIGKTFANKTVKLGASIDLNEGWTASESPEVATKWTPIGTDTKPFEGIFDGQGYSISGVFVEDTIAYMGFFGVTGYSSEIKNFRLVNSYFNQQATSGDGYTGSVAGELRGGMSNVYSNAIVKSGYIQIGGMVARTKTNSSFTSKVNIKNCWFDGTVIGGTTGRYLGGIVAAVIRGTCNMENVLFTGVIYTDHNVSGDGVYAGGIIGDGKANSTTINLKSVISAGQIMGENSGNLVHAVIGRVRTVAVSDSGTENATAQKPVVTFENVFATRECRNTAYAVGSVQEGILIVEGEEVPITSEVLVTGGVFFTSGEDRLIGTGTQEVAEGSAPALDFSGAWSMRTNGIPIPASFVDVVEENTVVTNYDVTALAKEIGLDYWNSNASIKDAVAYGAGNYLVSYTTGSSTYAGYISKLGTLGFTKYADNAGTDMASDGVVSGTYYKEATDTTGEWVLNITSVANESKIYISIGTDTKALDDNLKSATQEGDNAIALSMLEMVNTHDEDPYGNSFVFQLPNGHFIVSDGGRNEDGLKLVEFLKDQAGSGNDVIIDAWIITHYHDDHCGALNIFADDSTLRNGIYVEAIYACEPSSYALDYWTNQLGVMNKALNGAMTLTKKSDGTRPDVYQMHMGQRYYFNGITIDVIDTQEQHPVATWGGENSDAFPDEFNTSSTNCVFSFTDKAETTKKILIGGDATTVNMEYIIDVYGTTNKTLSNIDVFAAYHHGHNMTATYGAMTVSTKYQGFSVDASANGEANKDWINFLLNNNDDKKFDAVLFSYNHIYRANLEYSGSLVNGGRDYYYKGTDGNVVYPYNIGEINDYLASSTCTANAYTYENGTVKITFDGSNTTKVFGKGVFAE